MNGSTLIAYDRKLSRAELAALPTPGATETHKPVPHSELAEALVEALSFRHIAVHKDEYAVTPDGMKMFGIMELETQFEGCRFALGIRNSHDKSMRLALTVGYRVLVCQNMAFQGDFEPVLAKHSKNFQINDALAIGIDQMQRNFKPMVEAVSQWRQAQLSDTEAKLVIYRAFIESELDVARHLAKHVHESYFNPAHEEFRPRTMWSLSNAFTSAFKEYLEPIPQFKATAKLGAFLSAAR